MSAVVPIRPPPADREPDLANAAARLLMTLALDGKTGLISEHTLAAGDALRRALARARTLRKVG